MPDNRFDLIHVPATRQSIFAGQYIITDKESDFRRRFFSKEKLNEYIARRYPPIKPKNNKSVSVKSSTRATAHRRSKPRTGEMKLIRSIQRRKPRERS